MTPTDAGDELPDSAGSARDIAARLEEVFRHVFDEPDLVITASTGPDDISGWDSLGTVSLLYAIEDEFGVEIADGEVRVLNTVGAIQDRLSAHASASAPVSDPASAPASGPASAPTSVPARQP